MISWPRIYYRIIDSGKKTPISAVKLCEMEVLSSEALDKSEILHLTIDYLLRGENEDLASKFLGLMFKIRG